MGLPEVHKWHILTYCQGKHLTVIYFARPISYFIGQKILPYTVSYSVLSGFGLCGEKYHIIHSAWFHTLLRSQKNH